MLFQGSVLSHAICLNRETICAVCLAFTSAYPCLLTKLSKCCDSRIGNSVWVILGILKFEFSQTEVVPEYFDRPRYFPKC